MAFPRALSTTASGKLVAQSIDMRTQRQFLEMLAQAGLQCYVSTPNGSSAQLRQGRCQLLQVLRHFPQIKYQRPEGQHAIQRKGTGCVLLPEFGQIGVEVADRAVEFRGVRDLARIARTAPPKRRKFRAVFSTNAGQRRHQPRLQLRMYIQHCCLRPSPSDAGAPGRLRIDKCLISSLVKSRKCQLAFGFIQLLGNATPQVVHLPIELPNLLLVVDSLQRGAATARYSRTCAIQNVGDLIAQALAGPNRPQQGSDGESDE
jgi:hypothetical protein